MILLSWLKQNHASVNDIIHLLAKIADNLQISSGRSSSRKSVDYQRL